MNKPGLSMLPAENETPEYGNDEFALHDPSLKFEGRWKMEKGKYRTLLMAFVVFAVSVAGVVYGKDTKSRVVVFPFRCNWESNDNAQGVESVVRSELTRSGYFTITEQEYTYEVVKETVLSDFFKIDNVDVKNQKNLVSKANIVDMFAQSDVKVIVRASEKVNADFAVKGAIAQFGNNFRADIEVISIKKKETVGALVGECESRENIPKMLEQLSQQIVNVCKGVNVLKEIESVRSGYQQGKLTYEETSNRLEGISAEMPDVFAIHCALFVHYLDRPEMKDRLVVEGANIVNTFRADNEEDVNYLSSLGVDPFFELANVYVTMKKVDDAISVYNKAIKIYPFNHSKYFKQLGALYALEGEAQASVNAFKQALNLDPTDNEARRYLASIYEAVGDARSALDQYQSCLKYSKNAGESAELKEKMKQLQVKRGGSEK